MEPIERIASELCDKGEISNAFSDKVKNVVHAGESASEEMIKAFRKYMELMDMVKHMLRVAEKEFEDAF
jgi:hypothetical protein